VNNFCDQHADHLLSKNLPVKLKHIIKLTQCKDVQQQPVFKKPATQKRRQSNDTVESDITATSTPEERRPPLKKQRISSSFTMLNKSEPPPLHRQKGQKWTEQSDLEVPDTEDDEASMNDNSLVIDEEEDEPQDANKTVIDNSVRMPVVCTVKSVTLDPQSISF
jgi:hypothetical protein